MKILVALKQVPDTETRVRVAADGRNLDPDGVKWITSPYDEYALEEAIRIQERTGAEVVAVTVGPERAREVLRNALALGAGSACLLACEEVQDPLAVARILADFARDRGFDLMLLGQKAFGGDHGAVGPMLAELLGLPQACQVTRLELGEGTFRAEREAEGCVEVLAGTLPAVITAQRGLNDPRYPGLKGIIAAKKKPIDEIPVTPPPAALSCRRLEPPQARQEGRRLEGDSALQARELARLLRDEARVI